MAFISDEWDYKNNLMNVETRKLYEYKQGIMQQLKDEKLSPEARKKLREELKNATDKIENLKQTYTTEATKQGVLDASGKLISAKDVAQDYMDKGYLALRQQQNKEAEGLALQEAARQKRAMNAQGQKVLSPGMLAAGLEQAKRQSSDIAANVYKQESELGYQKAGQELGRKEAYATKLTEMERADLQNQINNRLRTLAEQGQIDNTQLALLQQQADSANDSVLMNIGKTLLSAGAGALTGGLMGGGTGMLAGATNALLGTNLPVGDNGPLNWLFGNKPKGTSVTKNMFTDTTVPYGTSEDILPNYELLKQKKSKGK